MKYIIWSWKIVALRYFMVKIQCAGPETKETQWGIRLEKEKSKSFRRMKNMNKQNWNWTGKFSISVLTNAKLPSTTHTPPNVNPVLLATCFLFVFVTLGDGIDSLSPNVGKKLPLLNA